jgi:DNA-binding MarR family transcriptional regulator
MSRKVAAAVKAAESEYRLEVQAGHLLRRAHQRATSIFQELIGDAQITPTQFAALVKLHDHGGLSQNHLGRLTAMDPATIQGVTRRLQERALIVARPDPKDRRRTSLSLSPAGVELVDRLIGNGSKVTAAILAPLSPAEQETFLGLLKRLT